MCHIPTYLHYKSHLSSYLHNNNVFSYQIKLIPDVIFSTVQFVKTEEYHENVGPTE
jgi:hypothetical protein